MRSPERQPKSKGVNKEDKLVDLNINQYISSLTNLKVRDFQIKKNFDEIEALLTPEEVHNLKLCKLLYCTGFKKEVFLHLGTIIESRINRVVILYKSERWKTPRDFINEIVLIKSFDEFLTKKALSEKANDISKYNLFNSFDTSDRLKHKIQAFRFLRNYGGHSKTINQYLEEIIWTQPACDIEIIDAFNLIKDLEVAYQALINNPPQDQY